MNPKTILIVFCAIASINTTSEASEKLTNQNSAKVAAPLIQTSPDHGPFGNITTRPDVIGSGIGLLELRPVAGTLMEDPLSEASVSAAFAEGRLLYFSTSTLQQANETSKSQPITAKTDPGGANTATQLAAGGAIGKNTIKNMAPSPSANVAIHGTFLVERLFTQKKPPQIKLYQVRGPQKLRPEAPRFFPDGKKLLFQVDDGSRGPNSYRLYVVNLDDKSAKRLELDAVAIREVAISPDGRLIAVVGAGAMNEKGWNAQAAPQLFLYDLQTNKSRDLLKGDLHNRLPLGISWTGDNKLLFSLAPKNEPAPVAPVAPPKADDKAKNMGITPFNSPILSTIYETTLEGEPQRLFSGYNALPSPDGKWLSFTGQMDVNQPNYLMPHICLFDRKTLKRYTGLPGISHALWSPDSRQLVIGESHRQDGMPHLRLYSVGLDKWQTQEITSLPLQSPTYLTRTGASVETNATAQKAEAVKVAETTTAKETAKPAGTRPPFPAQWKPLLISPDGSTLYAQIKTYSAPDKRGLSTEVWNLQAVNLRDGTMSLLGALPGASGIAWLPGTLN